MIDKNAIMIERTMDILNLLASERKEISLASISNRLEIPKATAYRIITSLKNLGYINQNERNREYYITYKILETAYEVSNYNNVIEQLKPYLKYYSYKYNCNTAIYGYYDNNAIFIYGVPGSPMQISDKMLNIKSPLYASAAGKNLLATYSDEKIKGYIDNQKFLPYTLYTITDKDLFYEEILKTREKQFSICNRELYDNLVIIGIPIYDYNDTICASLNLIYTSEQSKILLNEDNIKEMVDFAKDIIIK